MVLIANIIIIAGWILYSWVQSLHMSSFDAIMILGTIFVVVDTIEIMLLRHGQQKWTHNAGVTLVETLAEAVDELKKNPKGQEAFMILAENVFAAGFGALDGESPDAAKAIKSRRLVLPPQLKQYEEFANQPFIKDQIVEALKKGKKNTKNQGDTSPETDW